MGWPLPPLLRATPPYCAYIAAACTVYKILMTDRREKMISTNVHTISGSGHDDVIIADVNDAECNATDIRLTL